MDAKFEIGAKISSPGDDPKLRIVVDPQKPIPTGEHRFVLICVDDAGNESKPAEVVVTVFDDKAPVAKLTVVPGPRIPFGDSFGLSADGSFDVGGTIKEFRWFMVG